MWRFLKELKIELLYELHHWVFTPKIQMFIAAMSTIAKLWKEPRYPSTDEWIKKMCVYVCVCVIFSHQKG